MKKKIGVAILMILVISTAAAGVKLSKADKGAQDDIAKGTHELKIKCGKTFQIQSMHIKAAVFEVKGKKKEVLVKTAGRVCSEALKAVGKLCEDQDYRAEIMKLNQIECIPNAKGDLKSLLKAHVKEKKLILEHSVIRSPIYKIDRIKKAFD